MGVEPVSTGPLSDPEQSPARTVAEGEVTYKVSVHAPEQTPNTLESPASSPKAHDGRRSTAAVSTTLEEEGIVPERVIQESIQLLDPLASLEQPRNWDSMVKDEGP